MTMKIIGKLLRMIVNELEPLRNGPDPSQQRCIALAITNIEQGIHWLEQLETNEL